MEQIYYTVDIGAVEAAQGLGCQWWRVVEHIETEVVVAKSPMYLECCVE